MSIIQLDTEHRRRIRLWVDALRSGRYKQGRGSLFVNDHALVVRPPSPDDERIASYCCLGVACLVAHQDDGVIASYGDNFLPPPVRDWFGLASEDPEVHVDSETTFHLSTLNDHDSTFEQIADYIEQEYLGTPEQENT